MLFLVEREYGEDRKRKERRRRVEEMMQFKR
jgi:hypothetical protein